MQKNFKNWRLGGVDKTQSDGRSTLLSVSRHKCPVLCSCRHIRIYLPCPLGPPHLYPSPPHQTSPCVTPCIWRCQSDDLLPLSWKLPKIEQTASYCYVIESLYCRTWWKVHQLDVVCKVMQRTKYTVFFIPSWDSIIFSARNFSCFLKSLLFSLMSSYWMAASEINVRICSLFSRLIDLDTQIIYVNGFQTIPLQFYWQLKQL